MSLRTLESPRPTDPAAPPYRLTVGQYLEMIRAEIIPGDARVELLDGIIVEQMTEYHPHNFAVLELGRALRSLLPAEWLVSEEKSLALGRHWRPEPDLAVLRGPTTRYRKRDPRAGDVALVVEVSDPSYADDRGRKWRGYASARIPVYWIVQLGERRVEVFTAPGGRGDSARYRGSEAFAEGADVPVHIDGRLIGRVRVDDLLG